jgi:hypothetical protein
MSWKSAAVIILLASVPVSAAFADELTQIVQQDLTTLGYDTGGTNGTASTKTIIAVSKFQAEHNLEPTGEITPQLAGVIKAAISQRGSSTQTAQPSVATTTPATPQQNAADLKARQQACLQEKAAAAQKANALKSGFGKLLSAVSRSSSQFGGGETAAQISTTASDAYSVNATVADLEGAAKDLGISESDVEACRNP